MGKIFFTPGPTQVYDSVPHYINDAINKDICSISHRGREFQQIFQDAVSSLKKFLNVPDEFHVFFLGSATEAMERIIENCVAKCSYHFVNGSFSKRFFTIAQELGKVPQKLEADLGRGFDFGRTEIPDEAEIICFTQNETSTGTAVDVNDLNLIKENYPDKIIAVDIVSSVPYVNIDYSLIDCTFFSVQKGFGLPAGLGVLILNNKLIEKSRLLAGKGYTVGSYHNFINLLKSAEKNQTPETPNVLGIYLLGKICNELHQKGIDRIRRETDKKAEILYKFFDAHNLYKPFVNDKSVRSKTIIAINASNPQELIKKLSENGFVVGSGYGDYKNSQIRIANFPMHKISDVEEMLDHAE
ncbi:aminotransferase class V-fold PLP-dependent enzyme [Candidatus Woesearchaeota archaeon]|nr:aminotransferase class V-fold PLP-dependent enzyme [Candidatus Woesearchaeota archaeon]